MNKKKSLEQFAALSPEQLEKIEGGGKNWLSHLSEWFDLAFLKR
ncbi:hypothetical protein STRDD11_01112 [Streptococcus sp. DD11]|nr:ComC/BlpC family leader-containing pheromone/bacteriocin [Streptococcus sp. DD11]KXT84109.1 hypothetical protein STRDD11_01112 [Streptococcus sp. DD11]